MNFSAARLSREDTKSSSENLPMNQKNFLLSDTLTALDFTSLDHWTDSVWTGRLPTWTKSAMKEILLNDNILIAKRTAREQSLVNFASVPKAVVRSDILNYRKAALHTVTNSR